MSKENKLQSSHTTKAGDPVTPVVAYPYLYITLIGTHVHSVTPANKAMFMHAAIRQLKRYPDDRFQCQAEPSKRVVLIFNEGYSTSLMAAFKEACLDHGVEEKYFVKLTNRDDLINYFKETEYRQVKKLDIFAHGKVGRLWFGIEIGPLEPNLNMETEHVKELRPDMFSVNAVITSYACQTGNGDGSTIAQKQNNSLAQALANATQAEVRAYMRRSDYEDVLGDSSMRMDFYESKKKWQRIKDLGDAVELTPEEKKRGNILAASIVRREKDGVKDVEFDPEGALMDVKAGTSPENVPSTQFIFIAAGKQK